MKNKTEHIFVNQIGYAPAEKKLAFISSFDGCPKEFNLCDSTGKVVYSGKLGDGIKDALCEEEVFCADFSDFSEEGSFTVCCGGFESYPVKIGKNLYNDLYKSILNYYTLSRCGEEVSDKKWGHPACHTVEADIYGTDLKTTITGGWHDAGDYGRYVVAGTKTIMDLLMAYENSGSVYSDFDILAEVRFELEWLLKMQREDGAVYHKISCYHFCGFVFPQFETEKQVLAPVSTAATADFAGCLAFASSFYENQDKAFADKLMAAALKAQSYLDSNEDNFYSNPKEITTGGYGDMNVSDERYFALCSIFVKIKDEALLKRAIEIRLKAIREEVIDPKAPWRRTWFESYSWGNVSAYGTEILLRNKELLPAELYEELKGAIITRAEKIVSVINAASYKTSHERVFWGSNGMVCDEAHILLLAYDLTGKKDYIDGAARQLDYVLGCNPINICYVTGSGTNSVKNPHHRPSGALKTVMPGMLSGGPSAGLQDEVARNNLTGQPPLKCFIDHVGSYSTNEVAIYWNSPLVYVIAKLGYLK